VGFILQLSSGDVVPSFTTIFDLSSFKLQG
jgi:hypothetical protein